MVQAELLPLGYYIPIDILDKFAEKIKLPPMDKLRAQSYAMAMALRNADAQEAMWTVGISDQVADTDATFLQISGGGWTKRMANCRGCGEKNSQGARVARGAGEV